MLALTRTSGQTKPVGRTVVLSDKQLEQTRTLDYDTLILLETSLPAEEFFEWLKKLAERGNVSLAGFEFDAKGGFEVVNWPHERFMPSEYEHFLMHWGCDFYKFRLTSQAPISGPLPLKSGFPSIQMARRLGGSG